MSTPVVRAENLRFSESGVDEVSKKFINILKNVVSFYQLYAEHDMGDAPKAQHVLDRWILARLNETLKRETEAMERYELSDAARVLQALVTDLSTWYVRRSRDRMKSEGADRTQALATLRTVLVELSKMIAPFMPFLAEHVYLATTKGDDGRSVHLEMWPEVQAVDEDVLLKMGEVRAIVSRAMEMREQSGKAVKQALGGMTITVPSGSIDEAYIAVILDEVNVKKADVKKGELAVELDLTLTPELIREGMAREVVRRVNGLRKEAGLTIQDRIDLRIFSDDAEVRTMYDERSDEIREATLSGSIAFTDESGALPHGTSFRVAEHDVWVGF